jgi:hypothetical protein
VSIARELRVLADNLAEIGATVRRLAREIEAKNPEPVEPWHGRTTNTPDEGPYRKKAI